MDRCGWAGPEQIYEEYHDTDWGVPEYDGRALWEKLVLDGFQAGLSWLTILKKRENFRAAFHGFDPNIIAGWGEDEVARLLGDAGIIRHRGKIEATIGNARAWQKIEQQQGFDRFLWNYVGGTPLQNQWASLAEVPAQTPLSTQISKDLKKAGFRFCGPTIVYAFMQAVGLVNDHLVTCPRHAEVARLVTERKAP
ncbi:DNA-3-methyladenine glycosylase I [Sedimentitalea todarodis]|uniref:DNA-3-methyladenine glycosylase I n=1 Tax=Sedimentitalea todarodis TaxID=1631240 RepID=A0ABU3VI17_9RHOB|nr:DNA-3-methyladenine glycosylase I [Sedimentitalea todarodis]MDU9005817.1 DNA-3-methyladenine glycosylase I [Sedimentitalea todarodis]